MNRIKNKCVDIGRELEGDQEEERLKGPDFRERRSCLIPASQLVGQ